MNADTDGLAGLQQMVEMQHYYTTQLMKLKKVETPLKKNAIQISINSLNSHNIEKD